jgi:hypothetical protein
MATDSKSVPSKRTCQEALGWKHLDIVYLVQKIKTLIWHLDYLIYKIDRLLDSGVLHARIENLDARFSRKKRTEDGDASSAIGTTSLFVVLGTAIAISAASFGALI